MTRIHILGLGNLGRFYAHALATTPNPTPITLLLHRKSLLKEWEEAGHRIEIEGASTLVPGVPSSSSGYDIEVLDASSTEKAKPIQYLIIATKAPKTVEALKLIAHRLNYKSTIFFTQNGLGTIEDVTKEYFNEPKILPSYLAAVTSHGVYSTGPFRSVLAGLANVTIGHVCLPESGPPRNEAQNLLQKITSAPLLNALAVSPKELKILQLQKLVINATINPLSVVFRRKNGDLFNHKLIYELLRIMLSEFSQFFEDHLRSHLDLDLSDEEFKECFSVESLERLVLSVAHKTAKNTSSMLQDVQAGRDTEIDYINGWFDRQCNASGTNRQDLADDPQHGYMRCNSHLVDMVKSGKVISGDEIRREFSLQ
ncbi:hypothetical protein EG329_009719 [Mollisiaceae sp. DMI_Dod_QoI]|nr:hypothetical protein EG329_009719 [Helotiales sp. DMI_Dod_QoI]